MCAAKRHRRHHERDGEEQGSRDGGAGQAEDALGQPDDAEHDRHGEVDGRRSRTHGVTVMRQGWGTHLHRRVPDRSLDRRRCVVEPRVSADDAPRPADLSVRQDGRRNACRTDHHKGDTMTYSPAAEPAALPATDPAIVRAVRSERLRRRGCALALLTAPGFALAGHLAQFDAAAARHRFRDLRRSAPPKGGPRCPPPWDSRGWS